jgi:hypothetical protein
MSGKPRGQFYKLFYKYRLKKSSSRKVEDCLTKDPNLREDQVKCKHCHYRYISKKQYFTKHILY